jgi:hypothetical protein
MAADMEHGLFDIGDLSVRKFVFAVAALSVISAPTFLWLVAARRRWLTWPAIGFAGAFLAAICFWLSRDDPVLRLPPSGEELSPAFDGAEKSYALLMRYSKRAANDDSKAFSRINLAVDFSTFVGSMRDPGRWEAFLTKNRAAIVADWAALIRQREWLAKLNSFDRIGDLTPARWDSDVINFQVWRALWLSSSAYARLMALDGRGDEAVAALVPLLEVGRKLGATSRTLVRLQIACLAEHMGLEAAGYVLDTTPVGMEARRRLASAVAGGDGPRGAERLPLLDGTTYPSFLNGVPFGDQIDAVGGPRVLRIPLNALGGLFFNARATTNLFADNIRDLAPLARSRDVKKYKEREIGFFSDQLNHGGLKNIGGRLILGRTCSLNYVALISYWGVEDLRSALATRLGGR